MAGPEPWSATSFRGPAGATARIPLLRRVDAGQSAFGRTLDEADRVSALGAGAPAGRSAWRLLWPRRRRVSVPRFQGRPRRSVISPYPGRRTGVMAAVEHLDRQPPRGVDPKLCHPERQAKDLLLRARLRADSFRCAQEMNRDQVGFLGSRNPCVNLWAPRAARAMIERRASTFPPTRPSPRRRSERDFGPSPLPADGELQVNLGEHLRVGVGPRCPSPRNHARPADRLGAGPSSGCAPRPPARSNAPTR